MSFDSAIIRLENDQVFWSG